MTEESLFAAALEKTSAAERQAFLDEACAGDDALRQRLEQLLAGHDKSAGILDQTTGPPGPAPGGAAVGERAGTVVAGRYKLLEEIGEGGMGSVWVAEQTQPVRRKVALKLIKAGMDSRAVLSRFEAERQALALMDHPNIAKVLDGGTTESGRPYFVMEYVKGVPLTTYCDDARLSIAERLALFLPVCQAVQHAHTKGIIHRDLKPSNILICLYDGRPVPKVIDFGLAKAMHQPLTEHTLYTAHGLMLGTPLYMSPEQAEFNNLDVDTRTDVYALGVILYELLTGTTPLQRERFKEAAWHEMLRLIKEEEPPRPSARLSGSGSLPSVAAQRQLEPVRLTRLVRGELDWIVMKCLEKDRTRRYETANGLARDVQRYLADESVEACPPSRGYRLRKFARKYRVALAMAATIALLLVGGIVGTTVGLIRAERQRSRAAAAESDAVAQRDKAEAATAAERLARESAQKRLGQVEKGVELLGAIFQDLSPRAEQQAGKALRVLLGERLEAAAGQLTGEAVGDAVAVARLQRILGRSLLGLGHSEKAVHLLETARKTLGTQLGADDPDTIYTMINLALAYRTAGKLDLAIAVQEDALRRAKAALGPEDLSTITCMNNLASYYRSADKLDQALPLFEETLRLRKLKLGPHDPQTLNTMNNLALAYLATGKLDLALPLFEETLKLRRARLDADNPEIMASLNNLALGYSAAGKQDQAIPLLAEVLEWNRANLGADHPRTLTSLQNLAVIYFKIGKPDQAQPLFRQAADGVEKRKFDHENAGAIVESLSQCLEKHNQYDQAEPWRRKWLAVVKQKAGSESAAHAGALAGLGSNLVAQKKFVDAEPVLRQCLDIRARTTPDAWPTFNTRSVLGAALLGQEKYADAEPLLVQGYTGMKQREAKIPKDDRGRVTEALERLVRLYDAWGKPDEAAKWRKELEAILKP